MSKSMELIRKDFCRNRGIGNIHQVTFMSQGVNPKTGNMRFLVQGGGINVAYEHERYNTKYWSNNKSLTVTTKAEVRLLLDKQNMCNWLNQHFNYNIQSGDIGFIIVDKEQITVITAPDSMRFRESFTISL